MDNENLLAINNILIATNLSTLTQVEVDSLSTFVFTIEKDYFDVVYALLNSRNLSNTDRNRFYDYADQFGYVYTRVESKSDVFWIVG
jgi:hypothetical protein